MDNISHSSQRSRWNPDCSCSAVLIRARTPGALPPVLTVVVLLCWWLNPPQGTAVWTS